MAMGLVHILSVMSATLATILGRGRLWDSLSHLVIHVLAPRFSLLNQLAAALKLLSHELYGALQHQALRAPLTLEARNQFTETIEPVPDSLPPLLFCRRVSSPIILLLLSW